MVYLSRGKTYNVKVIGLTVVAAKQMEQNAQPINLIQFLKESAYRTTVTQWTLSVFELWSNCANLQGKTEFEFF